MISHRQGYPSFSGVLHPVQTCSGTFVLCAFGNRRGKVIAMMGLSRVAANVWEAIAPLKLPGLRMDHRMTVLQLADGSLLVHSPIEFSQELRESLLNLGKPKWFVAPSRFHDLHWAEWFRAFPGGRFVAVAGMQQDHPDMPWTDVLVEGSALWDGELVPISLGGMPRVNEVVLWHPTSRSLLVADLIFNIDADAQNAFGKLFLRANGIYKKAGISRMFRAYIKDRSAFAESLRALQSHSFERMIIGHGPNLGGNAELARAMAAAGFAQDQQPEPSRRA